MRYVISTPTEPQDDVQEAEEAVPDEWAMAQSEWDGDPDSWGAYQLRVEEYL